MATLLLTYKRAVLLLLGGWNPLTKTSPSQLVVLVVVRVWRWEWLFGLLQLQFWLSRKSQHLYQVLSWSRVDLWCKSCNNECNQWDWDGKTYQKRPLTTSFPVRSRTFISMIGRTPSASRTNMKWGTSERSTLNLRLSQLPPPSPGLSFFGLGVRGRRSFSAFSCCSQPRISNLRTWESW